MRNWSVTAMFVFMSILATAGVAGAAAPDLDWHELYGDTLRDVGAWVETHSIYGYVGAGYEDFDTEGHLDGFLMRLDEYGDTMWVRSYGDSLDQTLRCVEETPDGGYIMVGTTESLAGPSNAYFVRADASGDTIWTSSFDFGGSDLLYRVLQTPDMGFIAVGFSSSAGSPGSTDVFVLKVDEDGKGEWKDFYMGIGHNRGFDICATSDGNYVVTGYTEVGTDEGDLFLLKIDGDNGDSLWAKVYSDTIREHGRSLEETPSGDLVVVGGKFSSSPYWTKAWLLKTDADGDTLWTREYGDEASYMYMGDIEVTADLGYICVGYRDTSSTGDADFYFLKTDPDGDVQWTKMIGKDEREQALCVAIADDLGYVAMGYSRALPGVDYNVYVMKLEGDDAGVEPVEAKGDYELLALDGANPFTTEVGVKYELAATAHVKLDVYDIAGRRVATLADGLGGAGVHRASWDLTDARGEKVPSGVYFIRCASGGRAGTVKALVLR